MKILWDIATFFKNVIICNVFILVLNGFLAVITYCSNLVLLRVFVANIVRQLALLHFREAIDFLIDPYYQVLAYMMVSTTNMLK